MPANARPITLSIPQFAPDMPAFNGKVSSKVLNVIPRTPQSFGPLSNITPYSNALTNRCQGAAAYLDPGGDPNIFAGDSEDLYQLTAASTSWTTVSKSSHPYTISSDQMWWFAPFGPRVIAGNIKDPTQTFTLGSSSAFADLSADAPKARYGAVVRNFLAVANTNDSTNGDQPQRVWWSALNDPTNWPTPGTNSAAEVQSDYTDLLGDGGWIYGIVGNLGTSDGAVFQEKAVWRMVYAGPPAVFYFFPAEGVRGTQAPGSIVQVGPLVYYLGRDGFYVFDGTSSQPIGVNRVDKWFFSNLDQSHMARIVGTADPINKIVIWAWPDTNNTNGNPNNLLIYNWSIDRWAWAQMTVETLMEVLTFGYSIDGWTAPFGTLNAVPAFPFDSRVWTGGYDILAAFDTSHMLNYFNGNNLQATVDFGEIQPFPGRVAIFKNVRPLVDGGVPTVSLGVRNRLVDSPVFNTATAMNSLGTCPQRAAGRYGRAEVVIPENSEWTHLQGLEIEANPGGVR